MIKFLHSGMLGAPQWGSAAGATIATLDACLVNGFNQQTPSSINVTGGVATVTFAATHGFEVDSVVLVAGATPSGLNGEKRVLSATPLALTFDATGVANGAATGSITLRYAPLGWSKPFAAVNQAAYRSVDPTSTQMFFGVNSDAASGIASQVRGYEVMTAAATGTGVFPNRAEYFWLKSSVAAQAPWIIFGDTKTFYVLRQNVGSGNLASGSLCGFGDFVSYKAVDPFRCFIAAHFDFSARAANTPDSRNPTLEIVDPDTANGGIFTARPASGAAAPQSMINTLENYMGTANTVVSGGTTNPGGAGVVTYPSPINQGLILSRMVLAENGYPRGHLRGLLGTPQNAHASFNQMDRVQGQGSFAGKTLMAIKCGSPAGTVSQGVVFFDLTGPWES